MKRREFFKWTSLAAGGMLVAPGLVAASKASAAQEAALDHAVRYALENGALYIDLRIGPCELSGHAHPIFESDLTGVRLCTAQGWRSAILRDLSHSSLEGALDLMLEPGTSPANAPQWHTAVFDAEKVIARRSSDPRVEAEINAAWLRFADRPPLPRGNAQVMFLELLLEN